MKTVVYSTIFALACQAGACFAKEVRVGTKEFDSAKNWEVGDEVEGFGKVVKKVVKGDTVKIIFRSVDTVEFTYEETLK